MQSNIQNRTIFCRDNLDILEGMNSESVDLIYLDPPFNKKKVFAAPIGSSAHGASFADIFRQDDIKDEWLLTIQEDQEQVYTLLKATQTLEGRSSYNFCYLAYMAIRLLACYRVLKPTGSIYLHCDPTMSHYLKLLLDCIFGEQRFRNEIIWHYGKYTNAANYFQKNHDTIFFYAKSPRYYFEKQFKPAAASTALDYKRGWRRHKPGGVAQLLVYDAGKAANEIKRAQRDGTKIVYRQGKTSVSFSDTWDIPKIGSTAKERTGYPTQKPLALLERLIKASCPDDGVVLDPFCGCATTCIAAEKLQRRWIGIDVSVKAYELVKQRLAKEVEGKDTLFAANLVTFRTDKPARTDRNADHRPQKYVYIISNPSYPGEYKVGVALDVHRRLSSYQTSDPNRAYQVEFSLLTPHFRKVEKYIHGKYNSKHEWVSGELAAIKADIQNWQPSR